MLLQEDDSLTYAEALWDHITMDPEELGFRAGDLIDVFDMSDKDWWFGELEDREGWFPAAFVRVGNYHGDQSTCLWLFLIHCRCRLFMIYYRYFCLAQLHVHV